jgi:cyanophycinase
MPNDAIRVSTEAPPPPVHATPIEPRGSLIIIGGHESKDGARPILEEVARRAKQSKLVVATMGSDEPGEQWETYRKVFQELGVDTIVQLDVRKREELLEEPRLELFDEGDVVFFAGGDQTKVTSRFGGTALCTRMREIYERGATIAGTSSGASVMSEVMMTGGDENSSTSSATTRLAAGLAIAAGIIIDQHFAERGRISRLLKAVGQNPRLLGLGIDEDTAVVMEGHRRFSVMGSGAVYVVDGTRMSYSNAAEEDESAPSIHTLLLHVLNSGDVFDLETRRPDRI